MKSVLVVEDDVDGRRLLEMALAGEGYRVTSVGDGELAVAECLTADPDVILLDLHLPGMDGAEFLRRYRGQLAGRAKVIAISGATNADPLARGLAVDDFIGKPFDIDRLLRSVHRAAHAA